MPSSRIIPFTIQQLCSELVLQKRVDGTECMVWQAKEAPTQPLVNEFDVSVVGHYCPWGGKKGEDLKLAQFDQLEAFVAQQKQAHKSMHFFWLAHQFNKATSPAILVGMEVTPPELLALSVRGDLTDSASCHRVVGYVKPIKGANGAVIANMLVARSARNVSTEAKTVQTLNIPAIRRQIFFGDKASKAGAASSTAAAAAAAASSVKSASSWKDDFASLTTEDFKVADAVLAFCWSDPNADGASKHHVVNKTGMPEDDIDRILDTLTSAGVIYPTVEDHFAAAIAAP